MFFFIVCSYAKLGPCTVFKRPPFAVCLSSPHISLESPHISSDQCTHTHTVLLHTYPCTTQGYLTHIVTVGNGAQMESNKASAFTWILWWGGQEELRQIHALLCLHVGGHFDHQHYIHIAGADDTAMTRSCIFVCACVSDCMCVWCGCCIFMWLCGHLVLQAVCFR